MLDVIAVVSLKCSYIASIEIRKTHITFLSQTYSNLLKCHITGASFAIRLGRRLPQHRSVSNQIYQLQLTFIFHFLVPLSVDCSVSKCKYTTATDKYVEYPSLKLYLINYKISFTALLQAINLSDS